MASHYRKIQRLSIADAAYIAGLVDGEGTIALTRKHANENRQLAVSISSTEYALVDYVLTRTGVGKVTNKRRSKQHHTASFVYAVYNRHALTLLQQVHPYLQSYKRERSALILREYLRLTPRNGKYNDVLRSERKTFEMAVMSIKPEGTLQRPVG